MEQLDRRIEGDYIDENQKTEIEDKLGKRLMTYPQFVVVDKIKPLVQEYLDKDIDDNFVNENDKIKIEDKFGIILPLRLDNPNVSSVFLEESEKKRFFRRQMSKVRKTLYVKVEKDQEMKNFKKFIKPLNNMPNNIEMVGEITVEPLPFDLTRKVSIEAIESSLQINISRQLHERTRALLHDLELEDLQIYAGREEGIGNKKLILACRNTIATSLSGTVITHADKSQLLKIFRTAVYNELAANTTTKSFASASVLVRPTETVYSLSTSTNRLGLSQQLSERIYLLQKTIKQSERYSSVSKLSTDVTNLVVPKLRNLKRNAKVATQAYTLNANRSPAAIEKYIVMSSIKSSDETLKKIRKRVIVLDLNKKTELFNSSAEIFISITQAEADLMLSNDIREKALIKSAQNNFKVNFLFIVSEKIGFSDEKQILNLLLKISEMEKTKVFEYWLDGQSTNRLDNKEKRAIYNNIPSGSSNLILKDLPNGILQ